MFHYIIYAAINVIIAVPGLYGYASVIFNNPAFAPHVAALSKLVVLSSCVHQLAFALFSTLDFAIGTVQDAGLIFLSAMANDIANTILDNGGTVDEIVSTTLVILPLSTASLGIVLILLGKFKLLDIVSYLPMPVSSGFIINASYFSKPLLTRELCCLLYQTGNWGLFGIHRMVLFAGWRSSLHLRVHDGIVGLEVHARPL